MKCFLEELLLFDHVTWRKWDDRGSRPSHFINASREVSRKLREITGKQHPPTDSIKRRRQRQPMILSYTFIKKEATSLREICQQWIHKLSATDKRAVTHKARPRWLSVPAPKAFTCFTPFLCDISRQQRDLLVATEARLWVGPFWRFAQQVYSFSSS